jgi:hypothetical protein
VLIRSATQYCSSLIGLALLSWTLGCAGYRVGNQALFRTDIRTVYVPVFQSESYRRNLGEWLTEAVVKELENRSTYKVVHSPNADSVLYGRILSDHKEVFAEDQFGVPRDIQFDLAVEIRWVDRMGNAVLRSAVIPIDLSVVGAAHLLPEGGQSLTTAQQRVVRSVARQIVGQMEAGW